MSAPRLPTALLLLSFLHVACTDGKRDDTQTGDDTQGGDDTDTQGDTDTTGDTGPNGVEKVVVIGAGLSGLAAARTLHEHDCCEVVVLEAQDRVGGRISTEQLPISGDIVEASAQYHMGPRDSSLTPVIEEMGIRTEDYLWTHESWDYDGSENPVSSLDWGRFYDDATLRSRNYADQPDVSLEAMIEEMQVEGAFSYLDGDREIGYCVSTLFEEEYSSDASEMRAWSLWEGDDLFGNDQWFPDGMEAIPEYLAEGLDVRLSTPVTAVQYDDQGVTVSTQTGETFSAERVVVTVSLGVLKAGDIEFDPSLPSTNTDAIARLGMGLMDKVWLVFPEIFWDPDIDFKGFASEPSGQYASWNYWGGNALLVWHAGSNARTLEFKPDEEIIQGAMDTLRLMYGDDIPEPTETLISRFDHEAVDAISGATPRSTYTKGSYSFLALGSTPDDRAAIATPVDDRVFFAGEHTNQTHPALLQGAYDSGVREANNIIELLEE